MLLYISIARKVMEVTETRINKQSRLIADTNKHERSKLYKKTNRLTADYE